MLEPSHRCAQCSHQTVWQFQLDHHIQRKHRNVYATELFHAGIEPEEQYPCIRRGFKSNYKLCGYEHCEDRTSAPSDNTENDHFFESQSCAHCKYKGHSNLSLCQHRSGCEATTRQAGFDNPRPSTSGMEFQTGQLRQVSNDSTTLSNGFQFVKLSAPSERSDIYNFDCNKCSYRAEHEQNLTAHMLTHVVERKDMEWFCCDICPYAALEKADLALHVATHASVAPPQVKRYHCDKCSYRTDNSGSAYRHRLTHAAADEIDWFCCTQCSYRGKVRSTLKTHMLRHARPEDIDWFRCAQCSYRAKLKRDLKSHMVSHAAADKIEWFGCDKCSYRAKRRSNLYNHRLTHVTADDAEIRWFACGECSYRSKRREGLKRHMLTHAAADDIEWFNCDKCSYRCKFKSNLKSHMGSHARGDEIQWFKCAECSYRTKQKRYLNKHVLTAHVRAD